MTSHDTVVRAVVDALRAGHPLDRLMAGDVSAVVDGAGRLYGPDVGQLLARLATGQGCTLESVNGRMGLAYRTRGQVSGVAVFAVEDELVRRVWVVLAPEKLLHWNSYTEVDHDAPH